MTEPARLLHVFPTFGPGGTQLRMASIMNCLGTSFSHHIIALDGNLAASSAFSSNIQAEVSGPPRRSGSLRNILFFRSLVKSMRPAAVLTYNWGAIEATVGARVAAQCPVIHNECGFGADEINALLRRRVWARRAVLNTTFRTIVTSKTLLTIAQTQYKLLPHKVQLIRTGVDVNRFRPRRNPGGRKDLGLGEGEVVFGYVGGLRPEKNLSLLVRAFHAAHLPNSKLLMVGEGPCRSELEGLVRNLGIQKNVVFIGHQADPAPCLAMFDAFVISSATEQVSNAQLEAMASGLPVICTDVGDCREVLGESARAGISPPGDLAAYARALSEFEVNPDLRLALGAANRSRAFACYSKDRMVEEYNGLLKSAIASTGRC